MKKYLVTRSSMPPIEEYVSEIESIWETRWLTNMGTKHKELSDRMIKYLDVNNIALFCNGHQALEMTLRAMELPKDSEVITTPFTFVSTTFAIIRAGYKPVFCDINPDDYTIDVTKLEQLITEKTRAIVPVHVYGNICDVEAINSIAKKYDLKVVYDAAHAFGERYKDSGVGAFGDASMFSFHATKVFNTIEGGAVCYKDTEFGERIRKQQNFGIENEELITCVGGNAKMNEFQAAMGICNLRHIKEAIESRRLASEMYDERLGSIEGIRVRTIPKDVTSNYAYYPIVIDEKTFGINRDQLQDILKKDEIFTRKYFFPTTNSLDCISPFCQTDNTPIAEYLSKNVLTIPLYEGLNEEDIDHICKRIIGSR